MNNSRRIFQKKNSFLCRIPFGDFVHQQLIVARSHMVDARKPVDFFENSFFVTKVGSIAHRWCTES